MNINFLGQVNSLQYKLMYKERRTFLSSALSPEPINFTNICIGLETIQSHTHKKQNTFSHHQNREASSSSR